MAAEPQVVRCEAFDDCQVVGDAFKAGQVVDMIFDETSQQLARRLTDFASGLAYVSSGSMERLGRQRLRLIPPTPPGGGTTPDREPRRPNPVAGAGSAAVPVPQVE